MNDYSSHIGIIGGGIAGFTLGCTLKKYGINTVIFEKEGKVPESGAGISISPNGLMPLDHLDLMNDLKSNSYKSQKGILKHKSEQLLEMPSPVYSMNRRDLINILYKRYEDLGGEILFDHELKSIEEATKELIFSNSNSYKVNHIVACDGIKSFIRENFFSKGSPPKYSGYIAWRGFIKSDNPNVEIHFGPNRHLVSYPINKNLERSFTGIVKTKDQEVESWKEKGSLEDLMEDFKDFNKDISSLFNSAEEIYKWGIFIRPPLKNIIKKNITLIGDAAHPMVPFLGQGGCMAIEDAYSFGYLCHELKCDFTEVQKNFQLLRVERNNKIQKMSFMQGKLNHIKNPLLVYLRNQLIKKTGIVSKRLKTVHTYDAHNEITKELNS